MQQKAVLFIVLQVHSTCFGCQPHPSSSEHKTVTTAPDTGHTHLPPTWPSLATLEGGSCTQKIWLVPEAVVTVLCTPDDGCCWHPKHVQWTCRTKNALLFVASRWTILNTKHNNTSAMSEYVSFTEMSGYDSKQLNRFRHEPTDIGPDPLHLVVTLLKTMSEINITATLKNNSYFLERPLFMRWTCSTAPMSRQNKTQLEVLK